MAPSVKHGGFLVPNAAKASPGNPTSGVEWARMAEVDQVDFNTLSQTHRWSVLRGCKVTMAGTCASLIKEGEELGLALVDGQLVEAIDGTSAEVGPSQRQDRFDIIVLTNSGALRVVPGTPDFDPVLPEPGLDETILAAVFCPTSETSSFSDCIIDKRVMAPTSLLTKVGSGEFLIRNIESMSRNRFSVRGSGEMSWGIDTSIRREDVGTLRVQDNINLTGRFQANGDVIAQNLVSRNLVSGKNLIQGLPVGDEPLGALRQATDGRLYINGPEGWVEIATVEATAPTGTIIQSVKTSTEMPKGWVQLSGIVIDEDHHPNLFDETKVSMLKRFIHTGTDAPAKPHRLMTVPNLTNLVLIGTETLPDYGGSATITLNKSHLPPHNHNVQIAPDGGVNPTGTVGDAGGHTHIQVPDASGNPTGEHTHIAVADPHKHDGFEFPGQNSRVIAEVWGGNNKIDGPFNDRNHTSSVEPLRWTAPASVEVAVTRSGSGHIHNLAPQPHHKHDLNINGIPPHNHKVTQSDVGSATPIDVHQPSFSVFMYIKD